jgi:histone deacetylase complex regulatory component SIN3
LLIQLFQKRLLPERDATYQQFLKVFADKAGGKSSNEQMETEIKELLKDEPDLIEGFETFIRVTDQKKVEDEGTELVGGRVQ